MKFLKTSDIARAVGVHPNTVRQYEELGFLPPIPRTPGGYRMFTDTHLDQMHLAWAAVRCTWLSGDIRRTALSVIQRAKDGDLDGALEDARQLLKLVLEERARAEEAVEVLEHWARHEPGGAPAGTLRIGQVCGLLGVTRDMLRSWERNGLMRVPREPDSGYRLYGGPEINRIKVISTLRRARYSTMSILRMMKYLDKGKREHLREVLDTPGPEEDICCATDQWISTLAGLEKHAGEVIARLEGMIQKR